MTVTLVPTLKRTMRIMGKKMEASVLSGIYWGYIGIMEKKMETTMYTTILRVSVGEDATILQIMEALQCQRGRSPNVSMSITGLG